MKNVKKDFPIFIHHPDLVYLDSAATSLKPQSVIDAEVEYYSKYSANIKRGVYDIAEVATHKYEESREILKKFIGGESGEIVFTKSTTEAINLVTYALGANILGEGDEIVTTIMEHHSNFVPWQQLCLNTGATLKVIELNDNYELGVVHKNNTIDLKNVITPKTKILAITHVSNVLGTVNPLKVIAREARKINPQIVVVVDGAQAVSNMKVDVADLDCDLYAFSGHKMLGPTGVGVLWGKKKVLDEMTPFLYGGHMIEKVALEETTFAPVPEKFEAGTQPIGQAIALAASVRYLADVGLENIHKHEVVLAQSAKDQLTKKYGDKITWIGARVSQSGILSFNIKGVHGHDVGSILNDQMVCVRAGHHCAMPLHKALNTVGSVRASFYVYNTEEDVERFVTAVGAVVKTFR